MDFGIYNDIHTGLHSRIHTYKRCASLDPVTVLSDIHNGALIATGVVLFVFILIINTLFSILNKDKKDKLEPKESSSELQSEKGTLGIEEG